jgi:EamA-like transporter family
MTPPGDCVIWPGAPIALASAVLFGATAPFAKLLLGEVEPQLLAGLLYLGAGIGLTVFHFGRAGFGIPAPEGPVAHQGCSMAGGGCALWRGGGAALLDARSRAN